MKTGLFFILLLCSTCSLIAQSPETLRVRNYRTRNEQTLVREFVSFLSIPNIARDTANITRNTSFIITMMKARGIAQVQLLPGNTSGVPPAVYGEVKTPGATRTLVFYAHYDGQPVNPAQWTNGLSPFEPKLFSDALYKGGTEIPHPPAGTPYQPAWRLYGRSASDDKAGVFAILNGYSALVQSGLKPACNLKFFFEGEEEAGSPHLGEILDKHKALLQSDLWIICDGPVHQTGRKQIVFGVRGDTHLDLTVYASKRPLHSGNYGNWGPNPAMMLAKLLSSMKDDDGRVTIKGFYDDVKPYSELEKKALRDLPSVEDQLKEELGISSTEMRGVSLGEAFSMPTLNINGIQSGNVGKMASNQIPTFATAVLDLRLVLGNDWKRQQQKVIDHIRSQGYFVTDHEPTDEERRQHGKIIRVTPGEDGYNAQRTPMDLPVTRTVINAVAATTTEGVILQPTAGGSLPLFVFEKYLNARTITIPVVNHDNNQHAENENVRIGNLFDGMETMSALMLMK